MPPLNIADLMTIVSGFGKIIPDEDKRKVLLAPLLDFISKKDETAYMATLAHFADKYGMKKSKIITKWLSKDDKINYLFRNYLTTHPEMDARIEILKKYCKEKKNAHRTAAFKNETIPPPWVRKLKGFFSQETIRTIANALPNWETIRGGLQLAADYLDQGANQLLDETQKPLAKMRQWNEDDEFSRKTFWQKVFCWW